MGMETGCGANYWAREIKAIGHEVKMISPQFVKPYVKSNKSDSNDAEAICEAVTRPSMRFVAIKAVDQQDIQCIHRIRERLVAARTSLSNEIRGFLSEYGIVFQTGVRFLIKTLPDIIADGENKLTPLTRELLLELSEELNQLTARVAKCNERIERIRQNHPIAKRISSIPGVGPLSSTAIIAHVSDPSMFKKWKRVCRLLRPCSKTPRNRR